MAANVNLPRASNDETLDKGMPIWIVHGIDADQVAVVFPHKLVTDEKHSNAEYSSFVLRARLFCLAFQNVLAATTDHRY